MRTRRRIPAILFAAMLLVSTVSFGLSGAGAKPPSSPSAVAFFDAKSGWWQIPGGQGFYYGVPGDHPLMCDWNGDGTETVGVYRGSTDTVFFRNSNNHGVGESLPITVLGDSPICGDWDGDGVDSLGLFNHRTGQFYLLNDERTDVLEIGFGPELSRRVPVAGDWNGDGTDTVGLWDPTSGAYRVRKANTARSRSYVGYYGVAGDMVLTGDWDGDGRDSLAVYRISNQRLLFSNKLMTAAADGSADASDFSGVPVGVRRSVADAATSTTTEASTTTTGSELTTTTSSIIESSTSTTVPPATSTTTIAPTTTTTTPATVTTTTLPPTTTEPPPTTTTTTILPSTTTTLSPTTTTTRLDSSDPVSAIGFLGVPWSGYAVGNRDIDGPMVYYNSVVMPYDGSLAAIQKYFIYPDGYGAGDGGTLEFKVHRDAGGQPGTVVTSGITDGALNRDRSNRGHFPVIDFDQSVPVARGERIWISASNIDPNPTANYVGMDDLHLAATYPVSPLDPENRQLTVYNADLNLTPNRQAILVVHYTDGRKWGNGYVMSGPKMGSEYIPIEGAEQVRQTFTPDTSVTLGNELWVRLVRQSGSGPLHAELREVGGTTIFSVDASADRWPLGGSGFWSDSYLRERANSTWGWWEIPATTLQGGVEYELVLSSSPGTEYRAVGLRYGSSYMPGGFLSDPGAERSTDAGQTWALWETSDPTAHLSFFLRTQ